MSQARPQIVRTAVFALFTATVLAPVTTMAMPTPPQTDALDAGVIAKLLILFVQIPVAILTLVLALISFRGSSEARLGLVFVCSGEVVLAVWTIGGEQI